MVFPQANLTYCSQRNKVQRETETGDVDVAAYDTQQTQVSGEGDKL